MIRSPGYIDQQGQQRRDDHVKDAAAALAGYNRSLAYPSGHCKRCTHDLRLTLCKHDPDTGHQWTCPGGIFRRVVPPAGRSLGNNRNEAGLFFKAFSGLIYAEGLLSWPVCLMSRL